MDPAEILVGFSYKKKNNFVESIVESRVLNKTND